MIYADNAATTSLHPKALDAMLPYLVSEYGNPSAHYPLGQRAKDAIEDARRHIAKLINAEPEEIFFTSGGSESDNWALNSAVSYASTTGKGLPCLLHSAIEHSAIINTANAIEASHRLSAHKIISVDNKGFVSVEDVVNKCSSHHTNIVSIMLANNEVGSIQPVLKITDAVRKSYPDSIIHTDAVQAVGHINIDVKDLKVDMLSASAHKFHGPKGVGFLYIRKALIPSIAPFIYGGSQERNLRAGTENVAGIVGMGKAAEIAKEEIMRNRIATLRLSHMLMTGLLEIPGSHLNGSPELGWHRLPNNTNIRFDGISAEALLGILSTQDIYASAGSACHAGDPTPSHVLKAMGLTDAQAASSIRFTLNEDNTEEDVNKIITVVKMAVGLLNPSTN